MQLCRVLIMEYFKTFQEYYDILRGKIKLENPVEVKPKKVDLDSLTVDELRQMAKEKGLSGYSKMKKADLIKGLK